MATHVCHDAGVDDDVSAIGALDADFCEWGIERTHTERDHIHRATFHAAGKFIREDFPHFQWIRPLVGWARFVAAFGADERAFLDSGDIGNGGAGEERVWAFFRIQANKRSLIAKHLGEAIPFILRAIAPINFIGSGECRQLVDPFLKLFVGGLLGYHD
jgi:hypothetical protein